MESGAATELILVRHAPALTGGRLCGRTDVAADCGNARQFRAVREAIGTTDRVLSSPALRCVQTAKALWQDDAPPETDPAFWEQDFGSWEGQDTRNLPDLGPLDPASLASHRPPAGESFADLCARVEPALRAASAGGRVAIIAHAGTVRAALALALGSVPAALCFEIAPLSITRLRMNPGGSTVLCVNWTPS
ncbi:MAG: histidine phosphatase family protein [Paracoccaceae bacterium]